MVLRIDYELSDNISPIITLDTLASGIFTLFSAACARQGWAKIRPHREQLWSRWRRHQSGGEEWAPWSSGYPFFPQEDDEISVSNVLGKRRGFAAFFMSIATCLFGSFSLLPPSCSWGAARRQERRGSRWERKDNVLRNLLHLSYNLPEEKEGSGRWVDIFNVVFL